MRTIDERPGGPHLRGAGVERHVLQRPLPAVPASARLARMTARAACRAWRVPDAGDSAALAASELIALALALEARGQLALRMLMSPRRLRLELHSPSPPRRGGVPDGLVGQQLIDACCVRSGAERRGEGVQLFAEVALPVA